MSNSVYLDYNATAPVRPEVIQVMAETMTMVGNPSSVHAAGRDARKRLTRAREQVAALVDASPHTVIFTSGGTEANNQALSHHGALMTGQSPEGGKIAASAIEHPSVMACADRDSILPVDSDGIVDLEGLSALLARRRPTTLAVMLANNETGVIQPIQDVAAIAREAGVRLHVDAIQAAGKIPCRFAELGADTISLSAHKLGGPQGVGALVVREGREAAALLKGGAQEDWRRAGTENLPGIVGFGEAAALVGQDDGFARRVSALRDRLETGIRDLVPWVRIAGGAVARLPNTSCLVFPGLSHDTQLIHYDLAGIAISAGSACSSGKVGPSPVLLAMGLSSSDAASAIRVSFGWESDDHDVDHFISACRNLLSRRYGSHRNS